MYPPLSLSKVTQLTNVTTQYGMTSTENAYMWMFGFAGEAIARPIFGYLSRHFNVITLVMDLRTKAMMVTIFSV